MVDSNNVEKGSIMKKTIGIALGICAASMIACAIVHRRVIKAMVKGEPLPEPPAWHTWHKCAK
jgi:hypothetical protein